jgi:hypothetical protein
MGNKLNLYNVAYLSIFQDEILSITTVLIAYHIDINRKVKLVQRRAL